ncbi:MAG TPA: DNA mismatch endonuclease Vsr [Acidobacteriaceae bacterium]|nr:DNA mismatch endonuclease Vsr [Acidobacteriaceae bacterium]
MDILNRHERRKRMAAVRQKNTAPELVVRRILHRLGYRYRLHSRDLPGTPDIVFSRRRAVVFVHGCFWHAHAGCSRASVPVTRRAYWLKKFSTNIARDAANIRRLRQRGWRVLVVWSCETSDGDRLQARLERFLGPTKAA